VRAFLRWKICTVVLYEGLVILELCAVVLYEGLVIFELGVFLIFRRQ
jgi:hypothetical protein